MTYYWIILVERCVHICLPLYCLVFDKDVHSQRGGGSDRPRSNAKFRRNFGYRAAEENLEGGIVAAAPLPPHF